MGTGEGKTNPYFSHIFQNQEETGDDEVATISGSLPSWIRGRYVRVGPGQFDFGGKKCVKHFLDGLSMLTKFDIRDGKVEYKKRFLQSEAYKRAIEEKRTVLPEFCTDGVSQGFLKQMISMFGSGGMSDNNVLNLFTLEGHLLAVNESPLTHPFDTDTLETGPWHDFSKLYGPLFLTAHPIRDSKGDVYNVGQAFFAGGMKYQIVKIPNVGTGKVEDALNQGKVIASIYPSWGTYFSYFHSFAMTDKYVIVIEQPMMVHLIKLTEVKLRAKSVREVVGWRGHDATNRFHIVDKATGEVLKTKILSAEPFFFFHVANSFDDGDNIVIDVNAYPNADIVIDTMFMERLKKREMEGADTGTITRFVIPVRRNLKDVPKGVPLSSLGYTTANAVREKDVIIATPEEFGPGFEGPRVNPFKAFKRHKYIYGSGTCCFGTFENSLCRLDTTTKETLVWRDANYLFCGEPEFIPSPDAVDEDDGVILSAVSDGRKTGKDFLIFLNAKTMKEICRAELGSQIPQCVHGQFLPDKSMKDCFPQNHALF